MADRASNTAIDALVKIARAQQRGTLPVTLSVAYHASLLGITLTVTPTLDVHQTLQSYEHVLEWLRKNFPHGREWTTSRTSRWNRRWQRPSSVWLDWREYQTDSGLIRFEYPTVHVCREFKADTRDHNGQGVPKWFCVSCPKSITTTEAPAARSSAISMSAVDEDVEHS